MDIELEKDKLDCLLEDRNRKLKEVEHVLCRVKGEIDFAERVGQAEIFRTVKLTRKMIDDIYTTYLLECQEIDGEIKSINKKLEESRTAHNTMEVQRRRQKQLMACGLKEEIERFDKIMFQKESQCARYQREIDKIRNDCKTINAKIDPIEEECRKVIARRNNEAANMKNKMRERVAAILIQAASKNYLQRKFFTNKKTKRKTKENKNLLE
ncbi:dynein regulatory complex protein 9-like [Centruroides vittatus]|uniref:dynein regulatory complex protein 9-like n=1 Tax=Centruroides vittatus TaxID=120091 RepID=UPI00350FE1D3